MPNMVEPELYDLRMDRHDCICCGLPGDELHHGQWWCYVCVGREHYEDGPYERGTEADDAE